MASGFGTFNSTTRVSNAGAVVSVSIWQEVDQSARTVTVKMRVTAAYYRAASGSWTPGAGQVIYASTNASNFLGGRVGDAYNSSTGGTVGLNSVSGVTYQAGLIYNIQEGYVVARSGCYAEAPTIAKTYYYNDAGEAITDSWDASLYLPTTSSTRSTLAGNFTTDSIPPRTVAPSGLSVAFSSHTWNSVTGSVNLSSYGVPGDNPNRYIELGVCASSNTGYGPVYRYEIARGVNSASITVTGSSAGALSLKGLTAYKLGAYATNTQQATSILQSTVRYTPPAPGQLSYTETTPGSGAFSVQYVGVAANNQTSYDTGSLTRTVRYREVGTSTWTNVVSGEVRVLTDATSFNVSVPNATTYEIEAWMTYHGGDSAVSRITVSNTTPAHGIYGSIGDQTERLNRVYGSVNSQAKKLIKIYGSVGGVSKLIHEDNA